MWWAHVLAAHGDHKTKGYLVYCRHLDHTFLEFVVWHVDNPKIHSLSLLCSSTHSPTHSAPMFVASWTTMLLPDPPLPVWLPPHFHGHVFEASSILQGVSCVIGKECAEFFKTLPNRLTWLDCINYKTKPSVHLQCTDITCVCGPTHNPHTFLQVLTWSNNGTQHAECTPAHKSFFTSYNIL